MNPAELRADGLLQLMADFFDRHHVAYRVVGSMASILYGEPRFTNDVDIVADLATDNVAVLCKEFAAPDFYVSEHAVREAISHRHQFNILHIPSGLKVDVILPADDEFGRAEMTRGKQISSDAFSAWFASPEDVILHKLLYFQLGGSEKHLRDIAGILKLQAGKIDRDYIERWASKIGIAPEWRLVCDRA